MLQINKGVTICMNSYVHLFAICHKFHYKLFSDKKEKMLFIKNLKSHFSCTSISHTSPLGIEQDKRDLFGSIAKTHQLKVFQDVPRFDDDGEYAEEQKYVSFRDKNSAFGFHYECKKLAKQGRLEDCVKLFEQTMLTDEKVRPLESNFTVVMGALSRNGNLEKVLSLFAKLKQYNLSPSSATYTAIFNAFSNSLNINLNDLEKIYAAAKEKHCLNRISYNALLKAYSRHGNLLNCMDIFRDSILAGFEPNIVTFSYLLISCKKDKKNGSRHALQIWKQIMDLDINPDAKFFMHFFQVLLFCDVGDVSLLNATLEKTSANNMKYFFKKHIRNVQWLKNQKSYPNLLNFIDCSSNKNEPIQTLEVEEKPLLENDMKFSIKSLKERTMSGKTNKINVLEPTNSFVLESFQKCPKPSDRLRLIGGIDTIFRLLKKYQVEPTDKLLTVLAQLLEENTVEENKFLKLAMNLKVKLDADFFNCIMLRRAKRHQHNEAIMLLQHMNELNITPNYRTWCINAMSCLNFEDGKNLLNNLKSINVFPNGILYTSLIYATLHNPKNRIAYGYVNVRYPNFRYLMYIIKEMSNQNISADKKLISTLEKTLDAPKGYNRWKSSDPIFESERKKFKQIYKQWLEKTDFQEKIS